MNLNLTSDVGMLILSVAKFAWGIGLTLYVFFGNRRKTMVDKLDNHDTRIACIENDIKHLPSQDDIHRLTDRIDTVNGSIERLTGRFDGVNRAVDLINEHLIKKGD